MEHFFVHKFTWPSYSILLEALGYLRLSRALSAVLVFNSGLPTHALNARGDSDFCHFEVQDSR